MPYFKRQTHCSSCKIDCERPTYAMMTIENNKDVVIGLCPKCLGQVMSCAEGGIVTAEKIPFYRVERADRR